MRVATLLTSLLVLLCQKNGMCKEICPKMCTCDVYEGLKRADCSEQSLGSCNVPVAKSAEILNLSGNEITSVDEDCFRDYSDLTKLSLSRNSIHTLELFAFESLTKLNYLDLSDNRIEVFDNRILERNEKLKFLDLSKNKFMLIEDKLPLIISDSLEFLSLRNSHLTHVGIDLLSEVPKLLDLDISNNLLITLIPSSFSHLESLQYINLEYNSFQCDYRIEETLRMFKTNKVNVKIDKCVKNSKKPMFEKMIMSSDFVTELPEREDVDIESVWGSSRSVKENNFDSMNVPEKASSFKKYYEQLKDEDDALEEFNCDNEGIFESTCECRNNFIQFYERVEKSNANYDKAVHSRIKIIFILGVALGVGIGSIIYFMTSIVRKKCAAMNQKQVERQKVRDRILLNNVRVAQTLHQNSHLNSPVPAIRNRITVPQSDVIVPARSPIPTPRNTQIREVSRTPTESPSIRRRTEQPSVPQSSRSELSPTAHLIHKLFRNRDPSFLPSSSELRPLNRSEAASAPIASESISLLNAYIEPADTNRTPRNSNYSGSSEYLSIDNFSPNYSLDNVVVPDRSECSTPPPPYRSIFDRELNGK